MPKEKRERSMSLDRSRLSPYRCSSGCSGQTSTKDPLEDDKNINQWEDARCPVCMDHPHNALLLLCSSHDKGCHPFMCDTSYRHSNCFDQFRKSFGDAKAELQRPEDVPNLTSPTTAPETTVPSEDPTMSKLVCPLCRGLINGWTVVESARRFMNAKSRSCACETCDFSGTYTDLRKHARLVHPLVRPADADPERQHNWMRLERQRDLGDLLSTLQSSIGEERTEDSTLTINEGGWLTVFLFVRFMRPGNRFSTSRARAQVAVRRSSRRLWGETYDGETESRDDDTGSPDRGQGFHRHYDYVRRHLRDPDNQ